MSMFKKLTSYIIISTVFSFSIGLAQEPPEEFQFSQSSLQSFFYVVNATIDGVELASGDWIAAFNGDICVGAYPWSGAWNTVIPAMGDDGSDQTDGYLLTGEEPTFRVYDASADAYLEALASDSPPFEFDGYPFANLESYYIDITATGGSGDIPGCMDDTACNYNPDATVDDGSCLYNDCNNECGGTAFIDDCGECVGGSTGMEENWAMDCNMECFGEAYIDNCGECVGGSTGLEPCVADCNGDFGGTAFIDDCGECVGGNTGMEENWAMDDCGVCFGENADMDCSGECFGTAFIDDCGECVGGNTGMEENWAMDDCGVCFGENADMDCNGDCFGTAIENECGCVGGNTGLEVDYCFGCTDPTAENYDPDAFVDDGSCTYDGETPPVDEFFGYNQSSLQAFFYVVNATVDGVELTDGDWIGAFKGETCVGAYPWSGAWNTVVPVMGDDGSEQTDGYLLTGEEPTFMVYVASSDAYFDGVATGTPPFEYDGFPFANLESFYIDITAEGGMTDIPGCMDQEACNYDPDATVDDGSCLYNDCYGDCGGTAFIDDCGECVGGNTGMEENWAMDCNMECFGEAYIDNCGECVGGSTGLEPCVADCNGDFGGTAFIDDCGECVGGSTGMEENWAMDCNMECFGEAYIDNCGECVGGSTGLEPCVADCNGDFGGTAFIDDCGECVGGNTGMEENWAMDDCGVCFGENADMDCYGECFGTAFIDDCGECVGGNTGMEENWAMDDCGVCFGENADMDCNGECFGTAFINECGCVGGSTGLAEDFCYGCTDPEADNYDPDATIDDDSCTYDGETPPVEEYFAFNQSSLQAFFYVVVATIDEVDLADGDWIGAFKGEICVGAYPWSGAWNTVVPVMGDDGSQQTTGYLLTGEEPVFMIYDASANAYYDADAVGSPPFVYDGFPFANLESFYIDLTAVTGMIDIYGCMDENACNYNPNATIDDESCVYPEGCNDWCEGDPGEPLYEDCFGECGGTAVIDDCGECVEGSTGLEFNYAMDCNMECFGEAYIDNCGTCVGGSTGLEPCEADCNGDFGGTAFIDDCGECVGGNTGMEENWAMDDCGVCFGENADMDCYGECFGTAFIDDCGECVGGSTGMEENWAMDDCGVCFGENADMDCFGECFGTAYIDDCGYCVGGSTGLTENFAQDCFGTCDGSAFIDNCGDCVGGETGLEPCVQDCAGVWGGDAEILMFYLDLDGDGLGAGDGAEFCEPFAPEGWVSNNMDEFPNCAANYVDECGVCGGDGSDVDCLGVCFGNAVEDECGVCAGDGSSCNTPTANEMAIETDENQAITFDVDAESNPLDPEVIDFMIDEVSGASNGTLTFDGLSVTYTPNVDFAGSDAFSYRVIEGGMYLSEWADVFVTVNAVNEAPIAENLEITVQSGNTVSFSVFAFDPDNDDLNYFYVDDPIDGLAGDLPDLVYTAPENVDDVFSFEFYAMDAEYASNNGMVTITVVDVNDPPTIAANTFVVSDGDIIDFTPFVDDPEGDELTFAFLPMAVTFRGGSLTHTDGYSYQYNAPIFDFSEDYLLVAVSDGQAASDYVMMTFDLPGRNMADRDMPFIAPGVPYLMMEDEDVLISILALDNSGGFDETAFYTIYNDAANGTLEYVSGPVLYADNTAALWELRYTPFENYNGDDSFSLTVTSLDGESLESMIDISVTAVDDPPEIVAIADQETDEESDLTLDISFLNVDEFDISADFDIFGTDEVTVQVNSLDLDGVNFTILPAMDYFGDAQISLDISATGEAVYTDNFVFDLMVMNVPDAPVLNPVGPQTLTEDIPYTIILSATDVDGTSEFTFSAVSADPALVAVEVVENQLTFTPQPDQHGQTTVEIMAIDGDLLESVSEIVSVMVNAENDAPVIISNAPESVEAGALFEYQVVVEDIDSGNFTYELDGEPAGMTVDLTGLVTWTADQDGVIGPITLTVSDGEDSDQEIFFITVLYVDCAGMVDGLAYLDDCGVCVGGTTGLEPNLDMDCAGVCFGTAFVNECGCVGGTTGLAQDYCFGCTDPLAENFDPDATVNDGSCEYALVYPEGLVYNQSTLQAFYFIGMATILGEELIAGEDWIGAFNIVGNDTVCVGSIPWDGAFTAVPVMGDEEEDYTENYMNQGDLPYFMLYDGSTGEFINAATVPELTVLEYGWANLGTFIIDELLDTYFDCNGDLGGTAFIDDCGYCVGGNTGHDANYMDLGCGCDVPAPVEYCFDYDNDGLGAVGSWTSYCSEMGPETVNTIGMLPPEGWVLDCSDEADEGDVYLTVANLNNTIIGMSGTFDILYDSNVDLYGAQFDITGVTALEVATDNPDFTASVNPENGSVILMSFSGSIYPLGSGTLMTVTYEYGPTSNIGIENLIIAGAPGTVPFGYDIDSLEATEPPVDCNNEYNGLAEIDVCGNCWGGSTGIDAPEVPMTYYYDFDGDGMGDPDVSEEFCLNAIPDDYVSNSDDDHPFGFVELYYGNVISDQEYTTGSFDIYYSSEVDLYGFQMNISGVEILSADSPVEGMDVTVNSSNGQALGISFTGSYYPEGTDLLLATFTYTLAPAVESCIADILFSGAAGDPAPDVVGDCMMFAEPAADCFGTYNGDAVIDECGECTGGFTGVEYNWAMDDCGVCWGTNDCYGCTDPAALNYDETATLDDGSCEYPPEEFAFNQSSLQAFYFVEMATAFDVEITTSDWVGAFNVTGEDTVCVGAAQWEGPFTTVPVMGDEFEEYTEGYMLIDQVPIFMIFDRSEEQIWNADVTSQVSLAWANTAFYAVDLLEAIVPGCDGIIGSGTEWDDFGNCCLPEDVDCSGLCYGTAVEDGFGGCCEPIEMDCLGICFGDAVYDDCSVCNGNNEDMDCAGVCFGSHEEDGFGGCCMPEDMDDCGVCFGENADLDCAGVCFGTSILDDFGDCCMPEDIDDCGVCYGNNADMDCAGVCFGDAYVDICGVCDDNPANDGLCVGCCDPEAWNYNPDAVECGIDEEVCYYTSPYAYFASTTHATYIITSATINDIDLSIYDWVAAYNGDVLVGAAQWTGPGTFINVFGDDGNPSAAGYMEVGDVPSFEFFDASYLAYTMVNESSEIAPYLHNQVNFVDWMNSNNIDCFGIPFGTAVIDDCGVCGGMNADMDCLGICFGDAVIDDCGVCDGNNEDMDCNGVCFGPAVLDDFGGCCLPEEIDCSGLCYGTAENDDFGGCCEPEDMDCNNECFGTAYMSDECGCVGGSTGHDDPDYCLNCMVDFDLVAGWNWFSLNVLGEDMSLPTVLASVGNAGQIIRSQDGSYSQYGEDFGWFGTLQELDVNKMYKIQMTSDADFLFEDSCYDPEPFSVFEGWNWIGYTPEVPMDINTALASLNSDGLYIKAKSGEYAQYIEGYGWFGPLLTLEPFAGYMLQMASDAVLEYPAVVLSAESDITDTESEAFGLFRDGIDLGWNVVPGDFEFSGSVTASVYMDELPAGSDGDLLAAFVGDECRGFVSGMMYPPTGETIFMLPVFSNEQSGEVVTFRYYDSTGQELYDYSETVEFVSNMVIGNPSESFELHELAPLAADDMIADTYCLNPAYPNPFNPVTSFNYAIEQPGQVQITVFDVTGRTVAELVNSWQAAGNYTISWNAQDLTSGVYLIQMTSGQFSAAQKVMLIK